LGQRSGADGGTFPPACARQHSERSTKQSICISFFFKAESSERIRMALRLVVLDRRQAGVDGVEPEVNMVVDVHAVASWIPIRFSVSLFREGDRLNSAA
jgi:hypothetical protein